jgi:hypothetical protein
MIVSKKGKSYDPSDGSEQPHAASAGPRELSEWEEINRWDDDGPAPHARAAASPGPDARRTGGPGVYITRGAN